MGTTNYQHALTKKFAALTGELADVQAKIGRIEREIERLPKLQARIPALETLIESAELLLRDSIPDWTPDNAPPVRPYSHTIPIPFGSCARRGMDVLRRANVPMTTRQIAREVLGEAGCDNPDPVVLQKTQNAIDAALRKRRGVMVEMSDTYPAQWRSLTKPGIAFDP